MLRKLLAAALLLLASADLRAQDAVIALGDSFSGSIDSAFDTDSVQFSSVAGALLTVTAKGSKGFVPTLLLHDQTSAEDLDLSANLKLAGSKLTLKSFALPSSGVYLLIVGPSAGQTGAYKLTTKVKLGKTVKSFKTDGETAPGGGAIEFGALPGVTLTAVVKPNKGATAVPSVPLLQGPEGGIPLDGATELKLGKKPSATVQIELGLLGTYTFTPTAAGAEGEALPLTTKLKLKFPKVVKTQHSEPAIFANVALAPVSVTSNGVQAAAGSAQAAASFNGHRIAFTCNATNLAGPDYGGNDPGSTPPNLPVYDVFLHDLDTQTTVPVSVPGTSPNSFPGCMGVAIDSAGNVVAFGSTAPNMVANDLNGAFDIFVRNLQTGVTTRASVQSNGLEAHGAQTPSIEPPQLGLSGDGNLVVFGSEAFDLVAGDDNGLADIFVHDLTTGTTTRVSTAKDGTQANGTCDQPDISLDGTCVAFSTNSNTLLGGDGNNEHDIYVKVLATGDVLRASLTAAGAELATDARAPSISGDGRFVAFESIGSFTAAGNGKSVIWVKDLQTGAVEAVSVSSAGSTGNFASAQARISASGQQVLFRSNATNLVSSDLNGAVGDIFLRDRLAGTTVLVDKSLVGEQANGDCYLGDLSADGSHAVFLAGPTTTNLWFGFANDQNSAADFFVRF